MKKLVAVLMVSLFAVSVFAAPALEISGTLNAGVRGEFNKETQKVCVVYKRDDGDYGLIETAE